MEPFIDQISEFTDAGILINSTQIVVCLLSTFILSLIVAKTYQITYKGPTFSPAFMHTLVICAMVIAAVMVIIGSNIARAFSLVGALSIIRFRNAVKDPRDVAFIFLVMAIGMACGTGFYGIAVILTVITCSVILLLAKFRFGEQGGSEKVLRIQAPLQAGYESLFNEVLTKFTDNFQLLSVESGKMGTEVELRFSVFLKRSTSMETLIQALSKLNNNLKIEIVGSTFAYDL